MAHLPRDGKGRKKDAGGRVACNGHYDAAKGPPADQLLVTRSGSSLLKLARTTSQLGSPFCLRPLAALDQKQESGSTGCEAGSRRGLGQAALAMKPRTHFSTQKAGWRV
jgi:hypothetical protein